MRRVTKHGRWVRVMMLELAALAFVGCEMRNVVRFRLRNRVSKPKRFSRPHPLTRDTLTKGVIVQ